MKKKYIIPTEKIAEIEPEINLLTVSVEIADEDENDADDSEKVKEESRWGINW